MAEITYEFIKNDSIANEEVRVAFSEEANKYGVLYYPNKLQKNGNDELILITMLNRILHKHPSWIMLFKSVYYVENGFVEEDCLESIKELFDEEGIAYAG